MLNKENGVIYTENGVNWVNVEDMIDNPLNAKLYADVSAEDTKVIENIDESI
jgi:hypothetical protein